MLSKPILSQALTAMGVAHAYVGNPFSSTPGIVSLGPREGEIRVAISEQYSELKAPEITGDVVHQRTLLGASVSITVPLILGEEEIWQRISSTGTKGIGYSSPQRVIETTLIIVPDAELSQQGTLALAGTTWTPAAPKNTLWLWRASVSREGFGYSFDNGGKSIQPVTFVGMFRGANPEGHKVATIGDPKAQGVPIVAI